MAAGCTSGFNVNPTLPADFTPDANDKVCYYVSGATWNCAMTSFTGSNITRNGVTAFSQWAVGDNVGPNAISLQRFTAVNSGAGGLLALWTGALAALAGLGWGWRRRLAIRSQRAESIF